jgi:hypothetical protein
LDYIKEVVDSLKPILKKYGFRNKGLNWFYENEYIVKIFNIQKSLFGKQIYLNIGIKMKALEPNISYTFPGSQVGIRLDNMVGKEVLDFENNISNEDRTEVITKVLKSNPYDFFTLTGENESIKKFTIESNSIHTLSLDAKKYLDINS